MLLRYRLSLAAAVLVCVSVAVSDTKNPSGSPPQMSKQTRLLVIRSLNAETVFVRKALPRGLKGVTIKGGVLAPSDRELELAVASYGPLARVGDRVRITDVLIKDKSIIIELNGGPKHKKKWYQRIEVGGMGGMTPISPQDPREATATGTSVELAFDTHVPEMTGDQVRELLSPVLDFKAKSAAEAYMDTVPPAVKEAIKNHRVLVGMNREMVQYAKGRAPRKIRETDEQGKPYEEWVYGEPPQDVEFVRFMGDEVTQLKIMRVGAEMIVRTQKEVDLAAITPPKKEEDAPLKRPANAPTLRRPDEVDPDAPVKTQSAPTASTPASEPEWGTKPPQQQAPPPPPK